MKKTLKYSVMAFITALLFVFVSACNNTNANAQANAQANTQAAANNNDVVKVSYDRSAVKATKADFTLAQSKVKEKTGTDKETCFSCHTVVSELHTRGVHKDLDCTNCHFEQINLQQYLHSLVSLTQLLRQIVCPLLFQAAPAENLHQAL